MNIHRLAIFESLTNVCSGLLISIFIAQPIIFKIYDIHMAVTDNVVIAIYFTLISIFRGYIWRMIFHKKFYKSLHKNQ
jgi:hypothetical protein